MTFEEIAAEMFRLSKLLDDGLAYLGRQAKEFANAEAAYREAKAKAWLEAPAGTVPEREAWVNGRTAQLRRERDLADGMRQTGLEAVRSRRAQISALQSVLARDRAEAEFARTGPGWAA